MILDNTFLADRKTRLREHLEKDPSILEELPPESLAVDMEDDCCN